MQLIRRHRLKQLALVIVFAVIVWLLFFRTSPPREEWQPSPPYAGPYTALDQDGVHGFLPLGEAQEFCARRRWEPYATRISVERSMTYSSLITSLTSLRLDSTSLIKRLTTSLFLSLVPPSKCLPNGTETASPSAQYISIQ